MCFGEAGREPGTLPAQRALPSMPLCFAGRLGDSHQQPREPGQLSSSLFACHPVTPLFLVLPAPSQRTLRWKETCVNHDKYIQIQGQRVLHLPGVRDPRVYPVLSEGPQFLGVSNQPLQCRSISRNFTFMSCICCFNSPFQFVSKCPSASSRLSHSRPFQQHPTPLCHGVSTVHKLGWGR